MCDGEFNFMVLSTQISNLVEQGRKINPVKYSLKMFIMMTLYNFIEILKRSDIPDKEVLAYKLLDKTNQVFDILLMEGSINPIFDEEPEEIKGYSHEVSQMLFRNAF